MVLVSGRSRRGRMPPVIRSLRYGVSAISLRILGSRMKRIGMPSIGTNAADGLALMDLVILMALVV